VTLAVDDVFDDDVAAWGFEVPSLHSYDNLLTESLVPVNAGSTAQRAICYYFDPAGRKTGDGNTTTAGMQSTSARPGVPPAGTLAFSYLSDNRQLVLS